MHLERNCLSDNSSPWVLGLPGVWQRKFDWGDTMQEFLA
jgi:hypothetical protein